MKEVTNALRTLDILSETSFSQVPCCVEHFTYWPNVYKEVLCAKRFFFKKKEPSLCKTVFIFDSVTTILETLFNAFSHQFAYILNKLLCPVFLRGLRSVFLMTRVLERLSPGVSRLWHTSTYLLKHTYIFLYGKTKNFSCSLPNVTIAPQYER